MKPVEQGARIESIDVLRGFALLGILLLNILGFGLHSVSYFNPLVAIGETEATLLLNLGTKNKSFAHGPWLAWDASSRKTSEWSRLGLGWQPRKEHKNKRSQDRFYFT